jgi:hypothetical protein
MMLDLTPEERRALAVLLKGTMDEGHPHSPRIRVLWRILAKVEPPVREKVSVFGKNAVEIWHTIARLVVRGIVSFIIVLVFVAYQSGPSWADWLIISLVALWWWRALPLPWK